MSERQKTGILHGGSLNGTEQEIKGFCLEQRSAHADGEFVEQWSWRTDADGLIYGRFEGKTPMPPMSDIADEPPTPEASHAFLKDDNEKRINAMRERTGGKVELNGAFESMRATTYLKHLLLEYGLLDRADLDFEGQRSSALDKIEGEVDEHEEKMASALRQGKLMGERPGHVQGAAGPRLVR